VGKVIFDIETTSLFAKDGRTKLNDVIPLMCTFGIPVGSRENESTSELGLTTLYAESYSDVPRFLQSMCDKMVELTPMKMITFNGAKFDMPIIRRAFVDNGVTGYPFRDAYHVDVYQEMLSPNFHFDTKSKSKSLKTLSERWLGYKYDMSGNDFFNMYDEWQLTGNDDILKKLIDYNQADVINTWKLYNLLKPFTPKYWERGKSL
jgi:DNA polymerase elongation subunit (family B)